MRTHSTLCLCLSRVFSRVVTSPLAPPDGYFSFYQFGIFYTKPWEPISTWNSFVALMGDHMASTKRKATLNSHSATSNCAPMDCGTKRRIIEGGNCWIGNFVNPNARSRNDQIWVLPISSSNKASNENNFLLGKWNKGSPLTLPTPRNPSKDKNPVRFFHTTKTLVGNQLNPPRVSQILLTMEPQNLIINDIYNGLWEYCQTNGFFAKWNPSAWLAQNLLWWPGKNFFPQKWCFFLDCSSLDLRKKFYMDILSFWKGVI